jgi:hypothetical protein
MLIRGIGSEKLGLEMWLPFDARPSPVHEIIVIIQVQAGEIVSLPIYLLPLLPTGGKVQSLDTSDNQANNLSQFHPPPIIKNSVCRIHLMLYFLHFFGHAHDPFPTGCSSIV